jgi:hypothetical protein
VRHRRARRVLDRVFERDDRVDAADLRDALPPERHANPAVFAIGSQLEFALAGLLVSVVVLGFVLSRLIIRQPAHA